MYTMCISMWWKNGLNIVAKSLCDSDTQLMEKDELSVKDP